MVSACAGAGARDEGCLDRFRTLGSVHTSSPELLALHGVRVLGMATASAVATRYRLAGGEVGELLLDDEARGWVRRVEFAGTAGWTVTDSGRAENERQLALELAETDTRSLVHAAHQAFLPLNRRLADACTRWQLRPTRADPLAANDHSDFRWDDRVLRELGSLSDSLRQVCDPLGSALRRFDGYAGRFADALAKVERGQWSWLDGPDRDSCHTLWVQLHEDLLATLGIPRGTDG
jgi:hypothetical protein